MSNRIFSLRKGFAFACALAALTGFAGCDNSNNGWGDQPAPSDEGGSSGANNGNGNGGAPRPHAGSGGEPIAGDSGAADRSGDAGASGTPGTSTLGTAGAGGSSGTAGVSGGVSTGGTGGGAGVSGAAGAGGASAAAGTAGVSGTAGAGGMSGTAGTAGTSGSAGTGGTSGTAGTAGTSGTAGTGGTSGTSGTAGSGGGAVCGNGLLETGEKCDTLGGASPSCDGTCQIKVSTAACVDCETTGDCGASVDNCKGPVGAPFSATEQAQCYAAMACIEASNCLDGTGTLGKCYCGTVLSTAACGAAPFDLSAPGAPSGPCAAVIKAGMTGFTSNAAILAGLTASSKPAGAGMQRLNCQKTAGCTDICGFTPGGPAFP